MRRSHILIILIIFIFFTGYARAENNIIDINLVMPQKYNTSSKILPIISVPKEVSGFVIIKIDKKVLPEEVENNKYLVEYFLDDELIFKTNGQNEANTENSSFDFKLNTAQYPDGRHKITVNFWDKDGSSAIGMENLFIKNIK